MQGEIVGELKCHRWRFMLPQVKLNLMVMMMIIYFFNIREKLPKCLGV